MSSLEGKKAPAFNLEGSDGAMHALKDYEGKTVVLYFYPKDDTPGCTKEACAFGELSPAWGKEDVVVLGVSPDPLTRHAKFIEKYGLPFVLLSDESKGMIEKYQAWGEKNNYGKTYMGVIRSTLVIDPSGKVLKHWEKIKNAGEHPAEVADFLESIN